MRAFIGQFDRVSLGISLLGGGIGAVWLLAMDLGIALAAFTVLIGSVALIIHHRWIEIGLLMIGIGVVVVVGYWIFGAPPAPPLIVDPVTGAIPVPTEVIAPGMAGLILIGGIGLAVVVGRGISWRRAAGSGSSCGTSAGGRDRSLTRDEA